MESHGIVRPWLRELDARRGSAATDSPNYWKDDPKSLITSCSIDNLAFGTGHSLFSNSVLPAIEGADTEVIIVTCFWARSATLSSLGNTLVKLSSKAKQRNTKITVRICFSSSSLFQKLFHTTSLQGRTYSPQECEQTFGLPGRHDLEGLDLEVKSIFVLPFSVMHPKFVILDRTRVLLPSCNVSWEDWFEGCVDLSGPIVGQFVLFWTKFWATERDHNIPVNIPTKQTDVTSTDAIFLPSPHHRNPMFRLPWQQCAPPPSTPLNVFLSWAFSNAKKDIYIQTPNLTSPPVLTALLRALRSGVDVTILTSERLMILEQLVTAGTTTKRCVKKLVKRHKRLISEREHERPGAVEAGLTVTPGSLRVMFFQPSAKPNANSPEPVQSHLKLTTIDGEWTVFGSGNLDRASWFTSQEVGVAFFSQNFAFDVRNRVDVLMRTRNRCVYDSRADG